MNFELDQSSAGNSKFRKLSPKCQRVQNVDDFQITIPFQDWVCMYILVSA